MMMPGRKYSAAGGYRYGFNGKENDNEVKGEGNQQDYGMRIYDTRLGKFLSVDPLTKKYPELTPYQFASNRPIDEDGLEWYKNKDDKGNTHYTWNTSENGPAGFTYVGRTHSYNSQDGTLVNLWDRGIWNYDYSVAGVGPTQFGEPPVQSAPVSHLSEIDFSKIKPNIATVGSPDIRSNYTDFEWGMVTSPATQASVFLVGGIPRAIATKLIINSTVQLAANGKNADVADIGINSFSPFTYANQWSTAAIDWYPLSGDFVPKIAFFNKTPEKVALDLTINHVFYGLGKLRITSTPLSNNQKLLVSTVNTVNKAIVKKAFSLGLAGQASSETPASVLRPIGYNVSESTNQLRPILKKND